jgi:uncharacterized LabA/DUF88 family protein
MAPARDDITASEQRLKLAVFIDFDNIEIGVKSTLSRRFDIGAVLEAIKERGEVITKIAYGDWKRAEDYSRGMTQHAVHMVQRNLTPGGDKNGADINLALDALEMAFTRDHINAFVIVGGDSDFIALVEKLKQYDKKVFVVGGRSFTSVILQKNCHEFIAYENLVGVQPVVRRVQGSAPRQGRVQLEGALPVLRRALKVLTDREVSPQLGLLKSTLLQLDSTFSEKDYGASSFREFMEKVANAGYVNLKQVDRSILVEMKESDGSAVDSSAAGGPAAEASAVPEPALQEPAPAPTAPPAAVSPLQAREAVRAMQQAIVHARLQPRWPMYLRNLKQFIRSVDSRFDERRYGFASLHDVVRQAQRENVLRVERNRQGILRIFPGERLYEIIEPELVEQPQAGAPEIEAEPLTDVLETARPDAEVERDVAEIERDVAEPLAPEPDVLEEEEPNWNRAEAPEEPPSAVAAEEKPKRRRRTSASSGTRHRSPRGGRKPKSSSSAH